MNRGTARYPLLEIDLDKLKANLAALIERCQSLSVEVTGVVKGFSALPEAAGVYTECGVRSLASSRLSQLRALRGAGVACERVLIRIPMLSELPEVAEVADMSLQSELETLRALNAVCAKRGTRHRVILMADLGDLREGFWSREELVDAALEVEYKLDHLELAGVGTNLGCYGSVAATPEKLRELVSAAEAHTPDLVIAPFWMVYPENYVEHIRPWEKALQHVLQRNPPRTRAYGYLPAGVYTGQEYAKHLIQKPNTFYYGSPCNKLYRRDLLRKHSLHFRKELFAEDQLFNTEYLRYVRTAVSIPDIGYYYLQCSQSVSHSRVTTADILRLRRRVMGLYKSIYTELGIYPETRAAILRSAFGENEFTLPPLDTPQTHCCKL